MPNIAGPPTIVRHPDGSAEGRWGVFALHTAFQPIFAFSPSDETRRVSIVAYESLLRVFRKGEAVAPDIFFRGIPEAERYAMESLTRSIHLLNAASSLDAGSVIFVNFDPSHFCDAGTVERALRDMRLVMHEAGLEAGRIVCEITEQAPGSEEALFSFVDAMRRSGFRIAVDDYGAAASDAARIDALKPDIVKFDAAWVTRLMTTPAGFEMLTDMVDRLAGRGIFTVFEGIEENWQLALAERSGAAMVQGFVLARPEIRASAQGGFSEEGSKPPKDD